MTQPSASSGRSFMRAAKVSTIAAICVRPASRRALAAAAPLLALPPPARAATGASATGAGAPRPAAAGEPNLQ